MLRIINGKRYNTETAVDILALDCGIDSRSDFRWEDTELYRTKNGNWFVCGQGGPMSRWARGNRSTGYSSGSGLMPISAEEAQAILEEHGQTKLVEQYFSDNISDA